MRRMIGPVPSPMLGAVALLGATALVAPTLGWAAGFLAQIDGYRSSHEVQIIGQLADLTRMRSIAADPAGLTATAVYLQTALKIRGFETQLLTAGPVVAPIVFGSSRTAGARRTVVFYAHYDGQPVTLAQWKSDPFVPVMRSGPLTSDSKDIDWQAARSPYSPEWRLFGRATGDDKASIVAFLAAFDALKAAGHKPSVNIKVVWEGEEEAGSPHLADILTRNRSLVVSDLWLIGDAPVHQSRRPMLYFGARGDLGLQLTVYGPIRALHDGHYGNWVPNPAAMAATLLQQMRDNEGRILIPGIYDDVRPVNLTEQQAIRDLPPIEDALKQEFGIARSEGTEGLAASLMRPALNVRGIRSGQVGEEAANAIPPEAVISMDFRLVPNQTPQHIRSVVESFLTNKGWTIIAEQPDGPARLRHKRLVRVQWESGYPALRSDMSTPVAEAVIAAAGIAANGPVAILPMMGGSVPIYLLAEIFNVPVIGLPIVNHDDNQHAANENLRLKNLWDGIDTYAAMLGKLNW